MNSQLSEMFDFNESLRGNFHNNIRGNSIFLPCTNFEANFFLVKENQAKTEEIFQYFFAQSEKETERKEDVMFVKAYSSET